MLQVYRANSFTELIDLVRNARNRGSSTFSYQYLANKLGYRSPRSLAMVHKGQRPPSRELVKKLIGHLELTPMEAELVALLAERSISERKHQDASKVVERIEQLRKATREYFESELKKPDDPKAKFIYLSVSELEDVRRRMKLLSVEIKCQYGEPDPLKTKFRFHLELFKT